MGTRLRVCSFDPPESFLCGRWETPPEKDLHTGVLLTVVCVGRGRLVWWSRT